MDPDPDPLEMLDPDPESINQGSTALMQCWGSGSKLDPDSMGPLDPYPDPEGQKLLT